MIKIRPPATTSAAASVRMQDQPPTARQTLLTDIAARWDKFSKQELSDLRGNDDLVTQVVAKYGLAKDAAQRDVAALLKGRTF